MSACFDRICSDSYFGQTTWEQAEGALQRETVSLAIEKAGLQPEQLDGILAGDLVNQCTSSSYGLRGLEVPFLGIYGACSTMSEGLLLASLLADGGAGRHFIAATSSHFSTAERQFRFPLSYGAQRTPTAQWTCTASGAAVLAATAEIKTPCITGGCIGRIQDLGVTDANNMGAAMAPSAFETIRSHFDDLGAAPEDFDLIVTGDLGKVGKEILLDQFHQVGVNLEDRYTDCGVLVFDLEGQDVHAGGSGCGCSAIVLCGYLLDQLRQGKLHRLLFCGTGALLSPTSSQQGESIPGVCHAVSICTERK